MKKIIFILIFISLLALISLGVFLFNDPIMYIVKRDFYDNPYMREKDEFRYFFEYMYETEDHFQSAQDIRLKLFTVEKSISEQCLQTSCKNDIDVPINRILDPQKYKEVCVFHWQDKELQQEKNIDQKWYSLMAGRDHLTTSLLTIDRDGTNIVIPYWSNNLQIKQNENNCTMVKEGTKLVLRPSTSYTNFRGIETVPLSGKFR